MTAERWHRTGGRRSRASKSLLVAIFLIAKLFEQHQHKPEGRRAAVMLAALIADLDGTRHNDANVLVVSGAKSEKAIAREILKPGSKPRSAAAGISGASTRSSRSNESWGIHIENRQIKK